MISYYGLENKPSFEDGQKVDVDMNTLGCPEYGVIRGKIVGKSITHIIDMWLVEFDRDFNFSVTRNPTCFSGWDELSPFHTDNRFLEKD